MSTLLSRLSRPYNRNVLQASILLGFGIVFLVGHGSSRSIPATSRLASSFFGLGLLVAAIANPTHLVISGLFYFFLGAAFFLAFKRLLPFDNALLIIVIGLALLGIALMARQGYVGAGALTPAIFTLLVGLIQYPPLGIARLIAAFILSLWFPGIALLILGLVYWFLSPRTA